MVFPQLVKPVGIFVFMLFMCPCVCCFSLVTLAVLFHFPCPVKLPSCVIVCPAHAFHLCLCVLGCCRYQLLHATYCILHTICTRVFLFFNLALSTNALPSFGCNVAAYCIVGNSMRGTLVGCISSESFYIILHTTFWSNQYILLVQCAVLKTAIVFPSLIVCLSVLSLFLCPAVLSLF